MQRTMSSTPSLWLQVSPERQHLLDQLAHDLQHDTHRIFVLLGAEGSGRTEAIRERFPTGHWFHHDHYHDPMFDKSWILSPTLRTIESYFQPTSAHDLPAAIVVDDLDDLATSEIWASLWPTWSSTHKTFCQLPYVLIARQWSIARWTATHERMVKRYEWPALTVSQLRQLATHLKVPADPDLRRMQAMQRCGTQFFREPTMCWQPFQSGAAQHSLHELNRQLANIPDLAAHEQWWDGNTNALHDSMLATMCHEPDDVRIMRLVVPFFSQSTVTPLRPDEQFHPSAYLSQRKQHLLMCAELCKEQGPWYDVDALWNKGPEFQPNRAWARFRDGKW